VLRTLGVHEVMALASRFLEANSTCTWLWAQSSVPGLDLDRDIGLRRSFSITLSAVVACSCNRTVSSKACGLYALQNVCCVWWHLLFATSSHCSCCGR